MSFPQTIDTLPVFTADNTLILADHFNLHQDILLRVRSVQEMIGTPPHVSEPAGTLRARLFAAENKVTALEATVAASGAIPVGAIVAWGGTSEPSGWRICDGRAHNGGSTLTSLLGGSANTPDLRDRFIVGRDAGTGNAFASAARTGGAKDVTLSGAQSGIQKHTPTASSAAVTLPHTHTGNTGAMSANSSHTHTITISTGGAHQHQIKVLDGNASEGNDGQGVDSSPSQGWNNYSPNGETMGNDGAHSHGASAVAASVAHTHPFTTDSSAPSHSHTITVAEVAEKAATASHTNLPPYYSMVYIMKTI